MSDFVRKRTQRGFNLLGYMAQLACLTVLTLGQTTVQAEETPAVAQANELAPGNNAKDLAGATLAAAAQPAPSQADSISVPLTLAQAKTAPVAAADDDQDLDLLNVISVTAQRRRTTERENTTTTYVVSKEQIKAFGARTVTDALKLIPGFTFADTLGGVVSDTSNYLRGLNSQRFVFLIDGSSQGRASNNRADTVGTLPVNNVERIEVILGGSTLRYGADAIAGVINVITRIPEGPPQLFAGSQFGSYGVSQYDLSYSGSNNIPRTNAGFFGFEVTYQRSSTLNDYPYTYNIGTTGTTFVNGIPASPGGSFPPGTSFDGKTFSVNTSLKGGYVFSDYYYGKAIFKPGKEHTITVSLAQQNRQTGSAGNRTGCIIYAYQTQYTVSSPNPSFRSPYNSYCYGPSPSSTRTLAGDARGAGDTRSSNTRVNAVWDWELSTLSSLKTQVALNSTHINFANPGIQGIITNRNIDASIEYISQLFEGNTLNVGYQFRTLRSTQASTLPPNALTPFKLDAELTTNAIYITDDWQFFNKALIVNAGGRFTNAVGFGNYAVWGAGLRYNFGSPDATTAPFGLRFNYSTSFKQPSISDLYVSGVINPTAATFQQFVANPVLRPELGQGFDLGLDISISPSMLLRATYYRTDIVGYFGDGSPFIGNLPTIGGLGFNGVDCTTVTPALNNGCLAQSFQSRNAQSYLSTGFEFAFNWQIDKVWTLAASQSFTDARPVGSLAVDAASFISPTNAGFYYDYPTIDIPFSQTGLLLTYTTPGITANLVGRIVGVRPTFGAITTPGYSQWDATFRVPVLPWLSVTGAVFNIFNDRSILASGLRLSSSPGNAGIISPPTTFRVGLEATF